jgi:hypothetical protein
MTRALRLTSIAAALFLSLATASTARAQTSNEPAAEVVDRFYEAFSTSDFDTMEKIYAPQVHWQDTIFQADGREKTMGVWRFELAPSVGGKITYHVVSSTPPDASGNSTVKVQWRDVYSFFGNPVDHAIDATLTVNSAGQITDHRESYSWSEWAHQAFPWLGDLVDQPLVGAGLRWFLRRGVYTKVWFDEVMRDLRPAPEEPAKESTEEKPLDPELRGKIAGRDATAAGAEPRVGMSEVLERETSGERAEGR